VGDRAAAGVPDEHDLAAGRVDGVDRLDHGVDVVAQGDLRSVGVLRLHAGQRERLHAVPGLPEGGDDLVPGRGVEPETGNQDDVHSPRLGQATDIAARRDPSRLVTKASRGTLAGSVPA
jgi:hypothetical protein